MTKATEDTTTISQPCLERPAARTKTEAHAMIIEVATQLEPVLVGARGLLLQLQHEMKRGAETMDEGGTVENWAGGLALIIAALERPGEDLALSIQELRALRGAA